MPATLLWVICLLWSLASAPLALRQRDRLSMSSPDTLRVIAPVVLKLPLLVWIRNSVMVVVPLISIALARAGFLPGVLRFLLIKRSFGNKNVPHAIETLSNQFLALLPNGPRAVALPTRELCMGARETICQVARGCHVDVDSVAHWASVSVHWKYPRFPQQPWTQTARFVISSPSLHARHHHCLQTTGGVSGGVSVSSHFAHVSGHGSFAENNSVTDVTVEVVQGAGPTRLTRVLEMSRDLFHSTVLSHHRWPVQPHWTCSRASGGQTAWGVWLRVDHWRAPTVRDLVSGVVHSATWPTGS